MRCPQCGNEAPQGSAFCNRCGTPLGGDVACPSCGRMIPANSVFCPKCGKMVRNDMADEQPAAGLTYNELNTRRQQPQAAPARQMREPYAVGDDDDGDDAGGSNFNRNLLIGIAAAVLIIGGLMLLRGCGADDDSRRDEARSDSALVADTATGDPLSTFVGELNRSNFMGDGATATAAVLVPGDGNERPERLWGVTCLSSATSRSFFKVYQLTRTGSLWQTELLQTKYLDGRTITMNNSDLMADDRQVPRAVKVDGKECLFFAYMTPLGGEGSRGRVTLNLFDIEAKKLTTLDYEGAVKTGADGRQHIYCRGPLDAVNSPERRALRNEAENVKVLYFPTEEEIKAEEEAREKEEMEKRMASPDSADARWDQDNQERLEQAERGEEVATKRSTYDKPIFRKDDIAQQIHSETYSVFLTKNGSVYGFDKDSRKYFTIYTRGANEIGFRDSKNNLLGIKTESGGHYQYNLANGKMKTLD